jgi:hypothetical protein
LKRNHARGLAINDGRSPDQNTALNWHKKPHQPERNADVLITSKTHQVYLIDYPTIKSARYYILLVWVSSFTDGFVQS